MALPAWTMTLAMVVGWTVLGVSTGVVAVKSVSALMRGVGTVWPMAVVFGCVGFLAGGFWGLIIGLAAASATGLFVGR